MLRAHAPRPKLLSKQARQSIHEPSNGNSPPIESLEVTTPTAVMIGSVVAVAVAVVAIGCALLVFG